MVSSVSECYVLRAAYGLATAYVLLCIVNADDSAVFLWSPYVIGQTIIFLPRYFDLLSSFFPRLISAAAVWMSTVL